MESDRRNGTRVEALVVVQLDDAGRYGVTRDVSTKGVLLATRVPLAIGAELDLVILGARGKHETKATVVRVERTAPTEEWPFRIAMNLVEELPEHLIEDGTNAAATLYRSS